VRSNEDRQSTGVADAELRMTSRVKRIMLGVIHWQAD
jgi:hypothetical protein